MDAWTDGATVDSPGMPADPYAANEAWISTVRTAEQRGMDVRTRKAQSKQDVALMHQQNAALSRRTFGMPEGYERIFRRER